MNIKPIYVYKWVNSKEYITYVFDAGAAGAVRNDRYDPSVIVIQEPIYQDSSKEDATNKIAYYINNQKTDKPDLLDKSVAYYAWVNSEPFLYTIGTMRWKGYDVNPFKSTDRKSDDIIEDNHKNYSKAKELFEWTDVINIVLKTDFNYENKYYYDDIRFKSNNYKVASDSKIRELYSINVVNNKIISEEHYNVVYVAKMDDVPSLIILFDKLTTSNKTQLIQYITSLNKAYYKLFKNHTFKNRRELSRLFKMRSSESSGSGSSECINIYYTRHIVITIFANGVLHLTFKYPMDNGVKRDVIRGSVDELNKYINKVLNINVVFKEKYINARIKYNAYKTKFDDLKRELVLSSIFTGFKEEGFYYKRTSNYKDRSVMDKAMKNDMNNNNIPKNAKDNADDQDTRIIVKKEHRGYMIDVKNAKSFFEFECLEYWVSKIIEKATSADKQSSSDAKGITDVASNAVKSKSGKSGKSDDSGSDGIPDYLRYKYMSSKSSSSSGGRIANGGGNGNDNKNYLINKLRNADKALWNDNNKSRKCQKVKQPIPLTKDEYNDFKSKGLNKLFDNSIIHNDNYYVCPRLWCPKSNVPLDEGDPNAKCPGTDEKPMRLNDEMKNKNHPRYVYLKKKDNIPCCGKKNNGDAEEAGADDDEGGEAGAATAAVSTVVPIVKKPVVPAKDNDKNYIMKNYPIYYDKRYGDIPEELYKLLYPSNYKEYIESCRSPNNINKKRCILRKGLIDIDEIPEKYANRYDNIIYTLAYLLDETKASFVENIKSKVDIVSYMSLDNGNICKDFGDREPVLYEYHKELYGDLKKHLRSRKLKIELPKFDAKDEKAVFKISRLLYIYKSYRKFIDYLSADDYPDDKGIQYLYSLVAFVYKRLLVVWENTINTNSNEPTINLLVPEYINDIITYYGLHKKTEIIMILKEKWKTEGNKQELNMHRDNKLYELMKNRDNIQFYEPLIIKTISLEKKHMPLSDFPNIVKIIDFHLDNTVFNNLKYISNLIKDESLKYTIDTIVINDNYTIDKIMLRNNILIRFNPQGIILLPYLMKELRIKNVVFLDDIADTTFNITIVNHIYAKFIGKIEKLRDFGIAVDCGTNNYQDNEITKSRLIIRKDASDNKGRVILFGKKNEFEEYNDRDANGIQKWLDMRLRVLNKLVAVMPEIATYPRPRAEFIERLVGLFDRDKTKIQIILEEIPLFTKEGLNDWYASSLLHTKYDYIDGLSDNFVDNGAELLFTQYLVKKRIPNHILYYHEANPNIIQDIHEDHEETDTINYENIYDNNDINRNKNANANNTNTNINNNKATKEKPVKPSSKSQSPPKHRKSNSVMKIPRMFEGEMKDLNSKWTKYKKKIWWQLKYLKNDYEPDFIVELFNYFKSIDNDIVNDYDDIIKKTFRYYKHEFNKTEATKKIKDIFRDPYFYASYVNAMNQLKGTKKTFKTLEIFLTSYFNDSPIAERNKILTQMSSSPAFVYHPNEITFFTISKVLNISIFIIHNRAEYGKAVDVSKRADEKDLSITTSIYKADTSELDRPLIMLYKKNEKTHLAYYVVRNANHEIPIYTELKDAPEEIKMMILTTKKTSTYSSSSSTRTSDI